MRRLLAVIALVGACSACGHQTPPAPTVPTTTSVAPTFPPPTDTPETTTPSCTYDCNGSTKTPPPFENPPNSTGIGKG